MMHVSEKHLEEFVAGCHRVASYGLVRSSSGNLSWRVNEEYMLITATRSWMGELTREQIAICRISDGSVLNEKKPSAENGFHFGILRERSDVNVVLHFQSPYATAVACSGRDYNNFSVIPEIPYYLGHVAIVSYLNPGSNELAREVVSSMKEHDLVILKNHGQVTVGKNFDEVIQKATFFELACEIILQAGDKVQFLSQDAIDYLRHIYLKSV
ncbi:MAG TPA: class II aldolase/adducin family protein [Candidatus Wunengus sp. YC63]|uniref:class II aldolase/adducin family protein n=1 Tax=unclassified Candidatus Wunengus TaxID=3367695 RepID=UPI00271446E5|nr:class II aldolase/adducin family protein [Candidatus Brocadiales bacterium]